MDIDHECHLISYMYNPNLTVCIIWHVSKLYVIALLHLQLPVATDSTVDIRVLIVIIFLKISPWSN